jgi:hypothetical protein
MRPILILIKINQANPKLHDASILPGGDMLRAIFPAREQVLILSEFGHGQPGIDRFSGLIHQFKSHRLLGLSL